MSFGMVSSRRAVPAGRLRGCLISYRCAATRHERLLNGQRQFRRIRRGGAKHKRASPASILPENVLGEPFRRSRIPHASCKAENTHRKGPPAVHSGGGLFLLAFVLTTGWLRP